MKRVGALVAALGGRFGWIWWMPVAVFVAIATVTRLSLKNVAVTPGYFTHVGSAAAWFAYLTLVQVALLWWRGRFAVSLGHGRGSVFAVLVVVTASLTVVQVFVNAVATRLEALLLGGQGVLVTSPGGGCCADPGLPPLISFGGAFFLVYGPPLAVLIGLTMVSLLRWGAIGPLVAAPVSVAVALAVLAVGFAIPAPDLSVVIVPVAAAAMSVGWFAFRSVPV